MQITLTVSGDDEAGVLLSRHLTQDEEFRGRVRLSRDAPEPGAMGPALDALIVEVAGPTVVALSAVLVAWVRRHRGSVRVDASRSDGTRLTIRAEDVRGLDAAAVDAFSAALARQLTAGDGQGADDATTTNVEPAVAAKAAPEQDRAAEGGGTAQG